MWVYIWALFSPSHCRAKPKSQSFSSGGSSSDSSVLSSLRSLPGAHAQERGRERHATHQSRDPSPYVRVHVGFLVFLPCLCKAEVTQLEHGR